MILYVFSKLYNMILYNISYLYIENHILKIYIYKSNCIYMYL